MFKIPYRLVAIDLDGTLLDHERRIPAELIELIRNMASRGVRFTLATGRHYPSALPFARQLGLDVPLITYNGAMIRCGLTGKTLKHLTVERSIARRILERMTAYRPQLRYVYLEDRIYADRRHAHVDGYSRAIRTEITAPTDLEALVAAADPTLIAFVLEPDSLPPIRETLKTEYAGEVHVTNSLCNFLEILHPEASKGKSLAYLAACLGIDREQILAIGDSWNDLEMIAYAGTGALVANAPAELWPQADFVANKPRSGGVAEILKRFFPPVGR